MWLTNKDKRIRMVGLSSDYIYATSLGNSSVTKYTGSGGAMSWGVRGFGNGQLESPQGIAVDGNGYVYVADAGTNRITKFTSDGDYVTQWGNLGSGNGQFSSPEGVAVDKDGNVYVADSKNYRVQEFSSNGAYLGQFGSKGSGPGQFDLPVNVAVDNSGHIYVVDSNNDRIDEFFAVAPLHPIQSVVPIISDFDFAINSSSKVVNAGESSTFCVNVAPSAAFNENVSLSVANLPEGSAAFFSQSTLIQGPSILTITTPTSLSIGNYQLTLIGTSTDLTHEIPITLTINPALTSTSTSPLITPTAPEFSGQLLGYMLIFWLIIILSVVIVQKKRIST